MFILAIFFTIVIFMGEKVVDEQFTQANISGYIQENLALDSQYFSGKDTTIFFIGNPYLLEDYPDIFTIKKKPSAALCCGRLFLFVPIIDWKMDLQVRIVLPWR